MVTELPQPPLLADIQLELEAETREHRAFWTPSWKRPGKFAGVPTLTWLGPRRYLFSAKDGFAFTRSTGEIITPGPMFTDDGSIPRVAWSFPDLDPWSYTPAFLIHDWLFESQVGTFEGANATLAEAIWTLVTEGTCEGSWFGIEIIYRAVSSPFGRAVWDRHKEQKA